MTEPNRQNRWIKKKMQQLRKSVSCIQCNSKNEIEFHHISKTNLCGSGRGRKERYYDIIYNPECYMPLCNLCHKVVHHE